MNGSVRRIKTVLAALVLGASAVAISSAPAAGGVPHGASGVTCPPLGEGETAVGNDINGDRVADTVYGGNDAIDVDYAGIGALRVSAKAVSPGIEPLHFGASLDYADLDGDGCADVVAGAPDLNTVFVLFGPVWPGSLRVLSITPPDGVRGDDFGAAVALSEHDYSGGGPIIDLWVGAPGRTVDGHADAGAVYHYTVDAHGHASLLQEISEAAGLVPGTANAGDRFGGILSTGEGDGVAVGMPTRAVDGKADAGTVDWIAINDRTGLLAQSQEITQNLPGVGGSVTAGDRFGAGLALGGMVVGIPGAAVGGEAQAGAVQSFTIVGIHGSALKAAHYYTENTPGVPGVAEMGDHFGAAVSAGTFTCQEGDQVAVGSPGEDEGSIRDAGSVTLITIAAGDGGGPAECAARVLFAGHRLGGTPTAGADLGQSLSAVRDDYGDDEDAREQLVVGVPGVTIDGVGAAGEAQLWQPTFGWPSTYTTITEPGGPFHNARFGSVLAAH